MNILGLNISVSRSKPSTPDTQHSESVQRSFSPSIMEWLSGNEPTRRTPALQNAFEQVPWAYRCVNVLAEQIANVPFLFSRGERGRETLITSGPLIDFYNRPHPRLNRFQYWETKIIWLLLRGECVRIPIFSDSLSAPGGEVASSRITPNASLSRRRPAAPLYMPLASPMCESIKPSSAANTEDAFGASKRAEDGARSSARPSTLSPRTLRSIVFLDPADMQPIIENHELLGWRYTGRSRSPMESQVFLPEEVWFDKLPNPFDCWRGLAPLTPALTAMHTDFSAACFMRNIVENNAEGGLIIRAEQNLTDEQRAQIASQLRNRRAAGNSTPILLWGATEVIQPTLSSADLQFLENRKFSRSEICAAFGVPEEIVCTSDHNKYDVMQGARLNFIENRLAPLCARLEAEEMPVIRAIAPDAVGWFDLDSLPIMQQARRERLASAKVGFDMGIPFNELNSLFDLGFKSLPWGNSGYLPTNLAKAGELAEKTAQRDQP